MFGLWTRPADVSTAARSVGREHGGISVDRTDAAPRGVEDARSMDDTELQQRAEHHASEAERLLAGRMGFINHIIKAGVHATLAVYYSSQVQRVH